MNPNVSSAQFQPSLPGIGPRRPLLPIAPREELPEVDALPGSGGNPTFLREYAGDWGGYTTAHVTPYSEWVDNPLPPPPDNVSYLRAEPKGPASSLAWEEEFIPTWRVTSGQAKVNPHAISHQLKHADPLALHSQPDTVGYDWVEKGHSQPVEHYVLHDGNHRTNAALERGQLLMPATVTRYGVPEAFQERKQQRLREALEEL